MIHIKVASTSTSNHIILFEFQLVYYNSPYNKPFFPLPSCMGSGGAVCKAIQVARPLTGAGRN